MKQSILALIAIGAFALATAMWAPAETSAAGPWAEVGDAGDLPGTAQVPLGSDALDSIIGTIASTTDADMYQVCLTGGGTFSAATVAPGSATFDTQLFLFDSAGNGVYANDDFPGGPPLHSLLPAGDLLTPSVPGTYYLAISSFNLDPVSPGGLIFFGNDLAPTGPGAGQPVTGWAPSVGAAGSYTIALTGAEFPTDGQCEGFGPTSIEVSKTASVDGAVVSGTISITNVGENTAYIAAIADSLEVHFPRRFAPPPLPEGSTPNWFKVADVPVGNPGQIPVGETVTIDYTLSVCTAGFEDANSMRNVVAVTLLNKPPKARTDTVVTRSESFTPPLPEPEPVCDAGDLPETAQVPLGVGALNSISGAITSAGDADMYQVCLTGGGTFSAATVAPGSATFDTQLFLFDSAGNGVYANDDSGSLQSLLPAGHALTPAAASVFYLAISAFDNDPVSGGPEIFPDAPFDAVHGPSVVTPIDGWTATGGSTGPYNIVLTGAEFC